MAEEISRASGAGAMADEISGAAVAVVAYSMAGEILHAVVAGVTCAMTDGISRAALLQDSPRAMANGILLAPPSTDSPPSRALPSINSLSRAPLSMGSPSRALLLPRSSPSCTLLSSDYPRGPLLCSLTRVLEVVIAYYSINSDYCEICDCLLSKCQVFFLSKQGIHGTLRPGKEIEANAVDHH